MTRPQTLHAEAVTLAALTSAASAARQLGLPHRTVSRWLATADSAELRTFVARKRSQAAAAIADQLLETVSSVMEAIGTARTREEAMVAKDRALALAIMIDKQTLMASATSNVYGDHEPDRSAAPTQRLSVLLRDLLPPAPSLPTGEG